MTQKEAWEKYPEHNKHRLGMSLGSIVCATCGYVTVERGEIPEADARELLSYWT